jgi:hypothetical protein
MDGVPMARRTFDVIDIAKILVHWHAGWPKNRIAPSLGVHRRTIRKYVAPAIAAGLAPGDPPLTEAQWAAWVREWFPELADARLRHVTWPAIAEHHERIAAALRAGETMATIHRRLRDERGLAVSVASFRRYVAANLAAEAGRSGPQVLCPAGPGAAGAGLLQAAGRQVPGPGHRCARGRRSRWTGRPGCGIIRALSANPAAEAAGRWCTSWSTAPGA